MRIIKLNKNSIPARNIRELEYSFDCTIAATNQEWVIRIDPECISCFLTVINLMSSKKVPR